MEVLVSEGGGEDWVSVEVVVEEGGGEDVSVGVEVVVEVLVEVLPEEVVVEPEVPSLSLSAIHQLLSIG